MGVMERPVVATLADGGKTWEQSYEKFYLKTFVPANNLNGAINNYGFRAPMLLVFEENRKTMDEAVAFAKETGLADIAAAADSSVLFVYPTCEGGWDNATEDFYAAIIAETKMNPNYKDGIVELTNMFTREFNGYFIRGAIFRADIYSYGKSADYVAKYLLKTLQGEYLWGPGEITPAMCSMERLSVVPQVERKDIAILSVGNSSEINAAFATSENVLIKEKAEYAADFKAFVRKFKMWCGKIEIEPDFEALDMTEEAGIVTVKTSPNNRMLKDTAEHDVGYFAYYNNDTFKNGPAPLVIGFHGAGDSSMFLTFVSGWWEVCHKYGFLYVSVDNHHNVPADEVMQVLDELKKRYNVDEHRIYAIGFSMGCAKTWDMFEQYPEVFAGVAPASALFPVYKNPFGIERTGRLNKEVPLPIFYSGGENSHLTELPFQGEAGIERLKYAAEVNKCINKFDVTFENKDAWTDPIMAVKGDRVEKIYDESRGSYLTIHFFDSEDGVCRTAYASISGQGHEYRRHTADHAWQFISKFTR